MVHMDDLSDSSESPLASVRERMQLFDSNTTDRRRSILFAMAVIAGFMGVTATSAVLTSVQHLPTVLVLSLLSAASFIFAGFLFAGRFKTLTADEELLWLLFDN
jgi:uncharacterized membrane protein AbrB (regulator of aidB expression)